MEIERRFFVSKMPENIEKYTKNEIMQGYIFFSPTLRLRKQDDEYILTLKSKGRLAREEYEFSLTKEEFEKMWKKTEGFTILKTRYRVPLENGLVCELDVFKKEFAPLVIAEVEFASIEHAGIFKPPNWFGEEITYNTFYSNSNLANKGPFYH